MVMHGETIHLGASPRCIGCGKLLEPKVCRFAEGYYIGTICCMGPNSRESHYYPSEESAQEALETNNINYRE